MTHWLWMIVHWTAASLWILLLKLSHSALFGLLVGLAVWRESGPITGLAVALSLITRKDLGLFVADFYNEVWARAEMDKLKEANLAFAIKSVREALKRLP